VPPGSALISIAARPPERLDVVVALDRFARVVDHQAGDMTVTVEARLSAPSPR
jgi:hypothetical protein